MKESNRLITATILVLLSVAYGGVFIYSAYTKSFPIYSFEYTLVEFLHMPWLLAAIAARLFIGLETGLGLLIAFNLFGKNKWVLKLSLWLLIAFSGYLIYLWLRYGNDVNCGCFGDAIWMSPKASLVKNAILLVVTLILIKFHNGWKYRWMNFAAILSTLIFIALPYFIIAIPTAQPNWLKKDGYMIDFSALYVTSHEPVAIDIRKGKHIVAYLSKNCPHCRIAAYKMHLMKASNPALPLFMIIGGESELTDFWKTTHAQNVPYTRLNKDNFLQATGGIFPLIIWVNDGKVEATTEYINLSEGTIEDWIKR